MVLTYSLPDFVFVVANMAILPLTPRTLYVCTDCPHDIHPKTQNLVDIIGVSSDGLEYSELGDTQKRRRNLYLERSRALSTVKTGVIFINSAFQERHLRMDWGFLFQTEAFHRYPDA